MTRVILFCLVVFGAMGMIPTQARAQFGNTPFDPSTWDPSDWVKGPEIEDVRTGVRQDRVRINNRTSDDAFACIGNSSHIFGWYKIGSGQEFSMMLPPSSSHVLKMRVMKEGKTISWDGAPTYSSDTNTPFHPKKSFELKRENGFWRLTLEGKDLGVYNSEGLEDKGIDWKKFEKFKIERNDIGFNITK